MKKPLNIILIIGLSLFLFYSDFIRDYVFKNIDIQMNYLYHFEPPTGLKLNDSELYDTRVQYTLEELENAGWQPAVDNYTDSWMEDKLMNFNVNGLIRLKWICTFGFILFFLIQSILLGLVIYRKKIFIKFSAILYFGVLGLAGLVYSLYYIPISYNWQSNCYLIAMELVHFLQSSLPTLLLIVSFKIYLAHKEAPAD